MVYFDERTVDAGAQASRFGKGTSAGGQSSRWEEKKKNALFSAPLLRAERIECATFCRLQARRILGSEAQAGVVLDADELIVDMRRSLEGVVTSTL